MLFDPERVGVPETERVADLPAGGRRAIPRPIGLLAVFVNGVEVYDGNTYRAHESGPGHVLDRFNTSPSLNPHGVWRVVCGKRTRNESDAPFVVAFLTS